MNAEKMTIAQIRNVIAETAFEDYPELIRTLASDPRKAVNHMVIQMQRVLDREADEAKRILQMVRLNSMKRQRPMIRRHVLWNLTDKS